MPAPAGQWGAADAQHRHLSLRPRQDHVSNFDRFLKVIQLVGLDPPCRRFHQQFRVVILVGKEGIEGQANGLAFFGDFVVADLNRFGAQTVSHD